MAEPLILLPDMMCDARVWAEQLTVLSYGRPVTVAPMCNGDRIEEIASGLLSVLPSRFAVCGHGMGGAVALELCRRAPERVNRLALIGTNVLSDTPQEAADREPRMVGAKSGRFEAILRDEIAPRYVGNGPLREAAMTQLQQMAVSLGADVFVRQERAMQRRRDQESILRNITQPTLVLAGRDDKVVTLKRHEFLAELIPYANLGVLDGVGHMVMLEDPEGTTEALYAWMRQPLVLR